MISSVPAVDKKVLQILLHSEDPEQSNAFNRFYYNTMHSGVNSCTLLTHNTSNLPLSSDAVVQAITDLRAGCRMDRDALLRRLFPDLSTQEAEKNLTALVKVSFMIDLAPFQLYSDNYRARLGDAIPISWRHDQSLVDFFQSLFPIASYQITDSCNKMKAWKLEKRYKIQIMPTNDLAQHLLYDHSNHTLFVFNQVTWLKAQLGSVDAGGGHKTFEECFQQGMLPPSLLRETLFSLYRVLFPLDEKSAKYVRRLVYDSVSNFDESLLMDPGVIYSSLEPFKFTFWGTRLKQLEDIFLHPPPSNTIVAWFERHTSERNALTIAIAGVFFAAVFGLLAFLIAVAQLILSYHAWKYPVT